MIKKMMICVAGGLIAMSAIGSTAQAAAVACKSIKVMGDCTAQAAKCVWVGEHMIARGKRISAHCGAATELPPLK
jgi:hypothetical protein